MDRNVACACAPSANGASLSARRAWIEIHMGVVSCVLCRVALRKESVDRNTTSPLPKKDAMVALRKESVDRNNMLSWYTSGITVALRKESVDRNP